MLGTSRNAAVGNAGGTHRNLHGLMRCQREGTYVGQCLKLHFVQACRHLERGVEGIDKSFVGQRVVENLRRAYLHRVDVKFFGASEGHDWLRHVGLEGAGGHDFVLVFHGGLHHVPVDGHRLITQVDDTLVVHTWIHEDVVAVRLMLLGCYVERVVAFGQVFHDEVSILARHALSNDSTCGRMAHGHLCALHMGCFFSIVSVFVTHIHNQLSRALRHWLNHERQGESLTILAVDANSAALWHVQLQVVCRCETQHNLGGVVGGKRTHFLAGRSHHPLSVVRHRERNLARLSLTDVGDVEHVVAALTLRHRGLDAADAGTNLARGDTVEVVNGSVELGSLVAGELHPEVLPLVAAASHLASQREGEVVLLVAVQRGNRGLIQLYLVAHRHHFHPHIVQWQDTHIADAHLSLIGDAYRWFVLHERTAGEFHAIHVETVLCLRQPLAHIAGTHIVVTCHTTRVVGGGEVACGIRRYEKGVAHAAVHQV